MLSAARAGDLPRMKTLLAADPNLWDCEYEYRKPLHFAVLENRREVVEFLVELGATLMSPHHPPLVYARDRGYDALAVFLESKLREQYNIVPEGESIAKRIRSGD